MMEENNKPLPIGIGMTILSEELARVYHPLCSHVYSKYGLALSNEEMDEIISVCKQVEQNLKKITEEVKNVDMGHGICKEKNCKRFATSDYNGHGHWVCDRHYEILNDYFDEEYK